MIGTLWHMSTCLSALVALPRDFFLKSVSVVHSLNWNKVHQFRRLLRRIDKYTVHFLIDWDNLRIEKKGWSIHLQCHHSCTNECPAAWNTHGVSSHLDNGPRTLVFQADPGRTAQIGVTGGHGQAVRRHHLWSAKNSLVGLPGVSNTIERMEGMI